MIKHTNIVIGSLAALTNIPIETLNQHIIEIYTVLALIISIIVIRPETNKKRRKNRLIDKTKV